VLLHMKDGNRLIWQGKDGFAKRLQKQNYAVITVDLRNHGDSKGGGAAGQPGEPAKKTARKSTAGPELRPADYQAMIEFDMEAVKQFIFEEHQAEHLNMNKMGIVGPEMGASVATLFALADWLKPPYDDGQPGFQTPRGQDVRALVLISPQLSFHGLSIPPALKELSEYKDASGAGVAFLFCVGKDDPQDRAQGTKGGQAEKLFNLTAGTQPNSAKRMYYQEYPGKLRGTGLLGQKLKIEDDMASFFGEHLKKVDSPWRDRQNKITKNP
jgi:pimeloyl-ACP methyl ester carboxylesterase